MSFLPPAVFFLITAALILTGFFELWRLICLLATHELAAHVPKAVLAQSFTEGLRFDFAIVSYLMLPFVAISLLPGIDIVRNRVIRLIVITLFILAAALCFFAHLADIEFFTFFNARLNGTALLWQSNAAIMLSMLWETYPVIRYLLLYGLIFFGFVYCIRKLNQKVLIGQTPSRWWANLFWIPILLLVFGLGARGRIEKMSPLRWGLAYFSEYNYANQLALNPVYTFFRDAFYDADSRKRVEDMMQQVSFPEAETITRTLLNKPIDSLALSKRIHTAVHVENQNQNQPNVIVIIMESFGSSHIGVLNNQTGQHISPQFDSLANAGTLFTNIYSNGMHTYAGLFSTLYGFPPGFGNLVLYSVPGYFHHRGLPQILKANGYHTFFMCPQDPHFDNMHGFLMDNGIDEVRSLFDCDPAQQLTIFGVPDHVMFDRAIELMKPHTSKPLFATLLTCSFHGPWIIPDAPFEHLPDSVNESKPLNAFKYSDWALGRFIRDLEADSAFDNTLVVITADNGAPWKPKLAMDLNQYQIPILLYWIGKDKPEPRRIDVLGSQADIVATVMGQLQMNWDNYTFGRDLLDSTVTNRFALCSEWRTISYVEGNNYLIEEFMNQKRSLYHLPDITTNYAEKEPELAADLARKARAVYQTGYFQMRKPIPTPTNQTDHLARQSKTATNY